MALDDEVRLVRRRLAAFEAALRGTRPEQPRGTARALGSVGDGGNRPATLPGVFLVTAAALTGDETEGAPWSAAAAGQAFPCTVLGGAVPAVGDLLPMTLVGNRWVAERGGRRGTCKLCVAPTTACGVALGATVSVYGNIDSAYGVVTRSADIDPDRNNTLVGSGTVGAGSPTFCVQVDPGVYLVRTEADGYDDDARLVLACQGCVFPPPAPYGSPSGHSGSAGGSVKIATSGQATMLAQQYDPLNALFFNQCDRGALTRTSAGSAVYPFPSVLAHATDAFHQTFTPATGTTITFYAGCGTDTLYDVYYYARLSQPTKLEAPGSGYAVGAGPILVRVRGTVTNVRLAPFRLQGVWEDHYSFFCITNGGWLDPLHYPDAGGTLTEAQAATYAGVFGHPPITGAFTVE